jgi:hypothetical protein
MSWRPACLTSDRRQSPGRGRCPEALMALTEGALASALDAQDSELVSLIAQQRWADHIPLQSSGFPG